MSNTQLILAIVVVIAVIVLLAARRGGPRITTITRVSKRESEGDEQ